MTKFDHFLRGDTMTRTTRRWMPLGIALAVIATSAPSAARREVVWANGGVMVNDGFGGPVIWNEPMPEGEPAFTDGFVVAAGGTALQDTPAGEAIEHMQAGDWLKAITAIESLSSDDTRLVIDPHGILRPLSSLKRTLIETMPDEGKRAFRRLNNPAAKTRLEQALLIDDLNEREQALHAIVSTYSLCDAAAEAADQLGDLRFEVGRFDEAAALYLFAAEHTATRPDDATLMAKRLFANARAERWQAFDRLAQYAAFRHADTAVALGGEDTAITDLIQQLNRLKQPENMGPTETRPAVGLPRLARPTFEQPLVTKRQYESLYAAASQRRMGIAIDLLVKPIVVTQDEQLFTLSLGSLARLDPETGSDLWRQGDAASFIKKLSDRVYHLQQGYHQALVVSGETLLAVVPDANTPYRSSLTAYNTRSGETRWALRQTGGSFANHGIVGEPLVHASFVYVVSSQPNNPEIQLLAINLKTGGVHASLALGSAAMDPNLNAPAELSPRLAMGQGHLFVLTNNGAIVAVDPADHTIAWAFTQNIRPSGMGMLRRRGQFTPGSVARHTGNVITRNGLVIAKDTRSDMVHAFREFDAAPMWAIQTESDATIVHADDRHVYVLGEELVAYDLRTGERVWWTPHAGNTAGTPVFSDDACLIAGSTRMTRVELTTGKLTHYRDDLAEPSALAIVNDRLLVTTDDKLYAYRITD